MNALIFDAQGRLIWSSLLIFAFSAVFLVVGVLRVVEFMDVGLSRAARNILIVVHLIGCLLFSAAMAMFAIDARQEHKTLMYGFFMGGLLTLFPIHIYVALKRRRKIQDFGAR